MTQPLLEIENLHISFDTLSGEIQAVNGVSLAVDEGEFFGIVGETGCGKTITGLSVLGMVPKPGRVSRGRILFRGRNLLELSDREIRRLRGDEIAMIFQDPSASLNPVFTIGSQLVRVVQRHEHLARGEAKERVRELLQSVGLPDAKRLLDAYPHELSGGMLQRVMIAMALSSQPALIIADEPTTALDVTIQAQILALLRDLQEQFGITIVLITHDLGVVAETCNRTAVLYAGQVAEVGPTEAVFTNPAHPYTEGLLRAVPRADRKSATLDAIPGIVPSNPGIVQHCLFADRCPHVWDRCRAGQPALYDIDGDHRAACFLHAPGEANRERTEVPA